MKIPDDVILPRRLWSELVHWRSGYRCERCERGKNDLIKAGLTGRVHAHHIDRDKQNNCLSNGESLCPTCHRIEHNGPRRKCSPDCGCGKHKPAWNALPEGKGPACGHEDWFRDKNGHVACRVCRREGLSFKYYSEPEYREKQIKNSVINRRLRKAGQ